MDTRALDVRNPWRVPPEPRQVASSVWSSSGRSVLGEWGLPARRTPPRKDLGPWGLPRGPCGQPPARGLFVLNEQLGAAPPPRRTTCPWSDHPSPMRPPQISSWGHTRRSTTPLGLAIHSTYPPWGWGFWSMDGGFARAP